METKKIKYSFLEKIIFILIFSGASFSFLVYIYFSFQKYFIGDDFPLLVSSQSLKSVLQPVGAHLRPVVRIHFLLSNIFGASYFVFNFLSLILHFLATFSLYLVIKEESGKKYSLFSSLIFFLSFSFNEAIFWVSATGIVYSFLFSCLSIYFFKKERIFISFVFLLLSSLSYETWIVLLFYFILSKKKNLFLIISSAMLLSLHFLFAFYFKTRVFSYGGFPPLKEIPSRISYYFCKNFLPFSYISEALFLNISFIVLVLFSFFLFLKNKEKFLLPLIFYFVPSIIFLASKYIPSRFFYFPALSFSFFLSFLVFFKKPWCYISLPLIIYFSTISPIINYLDGLDYLNYSLLHKRIVEEGIRLMEGVKNGDEITIVNRFSSPQPLIFANSVKGTHKIFLYRGRGIGRLIDLDVFVNFVLMKKKMKSVPLKKEGVKKIVIGDGNFVSKYSFKIVEFKK